MFLCGSIGFRGRVDSRGARGSVWMLDGLRSLWAQAALHDHARPVPDRDELDGVHAQLRRVRIGSGFTRAGIGGEYSAINSAIDS
jgi:hypothetical protein